MPAFFTLEEHTNDTEGFSRRTGAPQLVVKNPIGPLDRDRQIVRPVTFPVLHPLYKRSTGSLPDTVRSNKRGLGKVPSCLKRRTWFCF